MKQTTEEFIEKARKVHGDKYDYSKVEYKGNRIPVCIICPIHGEFWQRPYNHLMGKGCVKCSIEKHTKYTIETFLEESRKIHDDKYDYTKVNYLDLNTKVCIICPEHGVFWQRPKEHLSGVGCPKCSFKKRAKNNTSNTDEFIEKARLVHGDKYDYSKVKYKGCKNKICIICPEHGEFWQKPSGHLSGNGCPICGKKSRTFTAEEYIKKAEEVHGNKYDYSKVEYKNMYTKICVICPKHGEFFVEANNHLKGIGCKECYKETITKTIETFIEEARKVHGDKYDYSKVKYQRGNIKVCIICPIHGEFWQTPDQHLQGHGCPSCAGNKKSNTEEFIEKARKVHGDKYDYSKVEYVNWRTKVCIICPKHGQFWVSPNNHLRSRGCPSCKQSLLESKVEDILKENNINYIYTCGKSVFPWLERQHLDFYLPDYNIAIECQGEHHFYPVDYGGNGEEFAKERYEHVVELDNVKRDKCKKHKIKLLFYAFKKYKKNVIINSDELLSKILKE